MISFSVDPRTERLAQLLNTKLATDNSWDPHELAHALEMDLGKLQRLLNEELLLRDLKLDELRNVANYLHLCTVGLLIKIGALHPSDLRVKSVHRMFDEQIHTKLDECLYEHESQIRSVTR